MLRLLTCDMSAIDSACVRGDELGEQLWRRQKVTC